MANILTSKQEQGFGENLSELDALGLLANTWEAARDQYLGLDDFRRVGTKLSEGDLKGAAKSLLTGGLELGSNLIPFAGPKAIARLGRFGKLAKLFGAGAKTPVRGVAGNVIGTTVLGYGVPAVGRRLPVIGGLFTEAPVPQLGRLVSYDPLAGAMAAAQGSPTSAGSEAIMRLIASGALG